LKNGRAKLSAPLSGVGVQKITVVYSGDATYANVTSSPINETVLLTTATTPLIVPALTTVNPPEPVPAQGSRQRHAHVYQRGGAVCAGTPVGRPVPFPNQNARLFCDRPDSGALQNRSIALGIGQSTTLTGAFQVRTYTPGTYYLIAEIVPISGITSDERDDDDPGQHRTSSGCRIGFRNGRTHANLTLTVTDAAGDQARLSMSGGATAA